jgi:hypothetical protein
VVGGVWFTINEEMGFGVDDTGGAIGGGVTDRTGWSPAWFDGGIPGGVVGLLEDFELAEAAQVVATVESFPPSTYGRRTMLTPATL